MNAIGLMFGGLAILAILAVVGVALFIREYRRDEQAAGFPLEIAHEEYVPRPAVDAWAERKAATIRWRQHRGTLPALAVIDCWEIVLAWVIRAAQPPAPLYNEAAWRDYRKHMEGAA